MKSQPTDKGSDVAVRTGLISVSVVAGGREIREKLVQLIGAAGAQFACASVHHNGEDAVRRIPAIDPDVVLFSPVSRGMAEIKCMQQLTAVKPVLALLVITNYDDSDGLFNSLKVGVRGYLLMSSPDARILDAIVEVMNGGAPMTPRIARRVLDYFRGLPLTNMPASKLTDREEEIMRLIRGGLSNKDIADHLAIGYDTVRSHTRAIYEKLGAHSRIEAIGKYHPK